MSEQQVNPEQPQEQQPPRRRRMHPREMDEKLAELEERIAALEAAQGDE